MSAPRQRMVCETCGGEDVMRDAWAVWDVEAQAWDLGAVFDDAHCNDCDGETRLEERDIPPAYPASAAEEAA